MSAFHDVLFFRLSVGLGARGGGAERLTEIVRARKRP